MFEIRQEHDKPLAEFFETKQGKAALSALMDYVGYYDVPVAESVEQANFNAGGRAVIARILLAYEKVANPVENNTLGFN